MATLIQDEVSKLKRQTLRNNEYYNTQETFDRLYERSLAGNTFKKLLKYIADDNNIRLAYRNIKRNKGSLTRGTDYKTMKYWSNADSEVYIDYVKSRLNNYVPQSVRRVMIPKSNGKLRPLGIPTIGDRLVQQCIKQVMEPIVEAKLHKHNYGFRPNRSTKHALAKLYHAINISRLYYIVDIDIKGFFDNVNHAKLLKQLWTLGIRDKNLLCILSKMLRAEIEGEGIPDKGVPQGGILSPLLSNVVLNELDWWISDQWETFKTRYEYTRSNGADSKKYTALRRASKMKECYIVRYADDFKIICKTERDAKKMYFACKQWLKDRLGLDISEEKSQITNLRKKSTEFLGLKIGVQTKRNNEGNRQKSPYVIQSHMTNKAKNQCLEKLKNHIVNIQRNPRAENVFKYNMAVLGIQNYYNSATHINVDAGELAHVLNKSIHNRLWKIGKSKGNFSKTHKRLYKNNYKPLFVAKIALFPLADVRHQKLMMFSQDICNYTEVGRKKIHDNLSKKYDKSILNYLGNNPVKGASTEFNDNRLSRYIAQYGKCSVSKRTLQIRDMEVHHIKASKDGGDDSYNNLTIVCKDVHKLIHATQVETIRNYLNILSLDDKGLKKLNKLRLSVGNNEI
ncbi:MULTISPECIES: group II intron reverse transcriptase/maturase [Bacillus cereus group]|uniref:group II intron reverse transcriptase/maturase n=1 Tax=Bacillus cereus group TaxID=86661 RepID=UPI0022E8E83C|nr:MULTISPECIES: group II intron reverse transcriptase/maturase [unclassified Bacillus cereus group]MDA2667168.1 group II intron reverse transcriptase/maturase [Bacillus cereus group sp. Bc032]MDA2677868.1 group II intron reverse transcriptase/maturase [Bacillus cereus group sp. Bc031]MDA2683376.1 group II intron reverse transcriptase/maturase [Bacillus cereus group sp. Bc029]MDA2688809.1 group II intron reverse transcriptase/maturase [Bacillus cereus group sp. Bc030]MDA2744346.1 group II intr